jgi:hypothetical protein
MFFSKSKSSNEQGKDNAAAPMATQQQVPATAVSTNTSPSAILQQSIGNQAVAQRAQQTAPTDRTNTSTPEEQETAYVDQQQIDSLYSEKIYEPIKLAVLLKFGVGRGEWRRSDELNAFRQKLKDAARAQANDDITNEISNHQEMQSKSKISQAYTGMIANKEAHSLAKGSVNSIMEKEALKIVQSTLPADPTKQKLKLAAHSAAKQLSSAKQVKTDKIRKAALTGAQTKALEILKQTESLAVNEARTIVKGGSLLGKPAPTKDLSTDVRTQVTDDKIADKAIKLAIESDSLNSGLVKIGSFVDLAVPNDGDSGAFEFELKIPLGQSGGYAIISFGAEAERDDGNLTVSAQIGFGVGVKTLGLDANFQLGLYLEAQAGNSTSVMNLISYGMYRQINSVAPSAAESIWGQGGKSGKTELEEAELWASAIEAQDMEGENFVDVGTYKKLSAEFEAGIVGVSLSAGKKNLTHFDKETIIEKTLDSFGDNTKIDQLKEKAQSLAKLEQRKVYEASGEVELDLGFGSLSLSAEGSHTRFGGKPLNLEISIGASIPFQYGEESAKWVSYMSKIGTPALGLLTNISNALTRDKNNNTPAANGGAATEAHNTDVRDTGTKMDVGTDAMVLLPQFDGIGNSLAKQIQEVDVDTGEIENKIVSSSTTELTLNFEKEWDSAGVAGDWKLAVELGQTKSFEVDAGVVKFSVEKTKRLAEFGREKKDGVKQFTGGILGR